MDLISWSNFLNTGFELCTNSSYNFHGVLVSHQHWNLNYIHSQAYFFA